MGRLANRDKTGARTVVTVNRPGLARAAYRVESLLLAAFRST
jgi:hypothetical protein